MLVRACQQAASNVAACRTVRTSGTEGREVHRYMGWLQRLYAVGKRQAFSYGLYVVVGGISNKSTIISALLIGGSMVMQVRSGTGMRHLGGLPASYYYSFHTQSLW